MPNKPKKTVIKGGTVLDQDGERKQDVLVENDRIVDVGDDLSAEYVLEAAGCFIFPGLVDIQVHFREPGFEESETILTGSRGAALGGVTGVLAMPNTNPAMDDVEVVRAANEKGRDALCEVHFAGCITKKREGKELAPLGELYDAGVRVFTDDGDCVASTEVMRRAMEYARQLEGAVIAQHCEDPELVSGGHMNEGAWSSKLGIKGRPREAESIIVARDIELVRLTGARYHVLHMSTSQSAEYMRLAKSCGLPVSSECSPQHLTLTEASCEKYDANFKMNPPLRSDDDVAAMRRALTDGTIDAIATDHAPHARHHKEGAFDVARPGMLGVETAFSIIFSQLVAKGIINLAQAVRLMSWQPAEIASMENQGQPIKSGSIANLCVFDPNAQWIVSGERLASRSINTPFEGWNIKGKVKHTIHDGEAVVIDGVAQR